ncbi:MAG: SUMF1/EgtB/PvdO family nonheme iron enzyme [Spirochaetaceae bacterium]|jgi:formylglycine-generating enzyme required for sulfatase activity/TolB-like protein|nr:SUMF1/EgtB/PvdO family nonheme iron enzyme [Spirochaetaceae bacterium]
MTIIEQKYHVFHMSSGGILMKKWSALILSAALSVAAQAQIKPTLTILPFNGKTGEEEAVASLLSQQPELNKTFALVPCAETFSQLAADIEAGTYEEAAEIAYEARSRVTSDFAVILWAGKAGGENLCLFSMIDMKDFRQVAGDYRKYTRIQDLQRALPDIAKKMQSGTAAPPDLPKVSALPFAVRPQTETDGTVLFQMMNAELVNSGLYAVYPWALMIDSIARNRNVRYANGMAEPADLRDFGRKEQVKYALTGALLNMEASRLFIGSLVNTESADLLNAGQIEYAGIHSDWEPLSRFAARLASPGAPKTPETSRIGIPGAGKPGLPSSGAFAGTAPPQENAPPPALSVGSGAGRNPPPARSVRPGEARRHKPTLAILPFTDKTGGDQETIIILLANQPALRSQFTVLPCATNYQSLAWDILFKTYANREGINAEIRKRLNVDYTLIVRAEKVGTGNALLASLVNMRDLRHIAGHYTRYGAAREVVQGLPDLARALGEAAGKTPDPNLPRLTVLPFYTPVKGRLEERDADMLFQYLTIELTNSGKYAVYPWDLPVQTLISDFAIPYFGIIDPERITAFGKATGIPYMLTGDLLNLGTGSLFMSSIVNTEDAGVLVRGDLEYRVLMEDPKALAALGKRLAAGNAAPDAGDSWAVSRAEPVTPPAPHIPRQAPPGGRLVKIPAGTFTIGTPAAEVGRDGDEVRRQTNVRSFYLGSREVTQEEYAAVMGVNPSYFKSPTSLEYPVEQVSWFDAIEYCNKRSVQEGLAPVYTINQGTVVWNERTNGYRLPTEAEWEYACRAGTASAFYTGARFAAEDGNYDGTYTYNGSQTGVYRERTTPAGSFKPNDWGLYDMHGNVYEWCWDRYGPYTDDDALTVSTDHRIIRGGSWYSAPRYLRSGNRAQAAPDARAYYMGFRVARSE